MNGSNVTFGYDADDLLTSAGGLTLSRDAQTGFLSTASVGICSDGWAYDAFGAVQSYDAGCNESPVMSVRYARDEAGRIRQKDESLFGISTAWTYGYDRTGRLETVRRDNVLVATYEYDSNGNRLKKVTPTGTETGTYDHEDRLLSYGGVSYTYAADGQLSTRTDAGGTAIFDYDALGNLRNVTLADGRVIEYAIDGLNRRVAKKVDGTVVARWLYDAAGRIVAELDGDGVLMSRFVYATRSNVPDYMLRQGRYRIISDHLGSPRVVINTATGEIAQMIGYDEFGNVLSDSNPGFQPFGFAGGLYDRDTNLVRFGARDYDPQMGRWTAKDPIGFAGDSSNLYVYAYSDPINFFDPSGLDALTSDPHALAMMASLFGAAQYGLDPTEQAAQILQDPNTGKYICYKMRSDHAVAQQRIPFKHPWAVALIHTHPSHGKTERADMGQDPKAAETMGIPNYVLSRKGIHKYTPPPAGGRSGSGVETTEVDNRAYVNQNGDNWWMFVDSDGCGCH